MYHYEFNDTGGYDAMSSAFEVYGPKSDYAILALVDVSEFDDGKPNSGWDWQHRRCALAEAFVKMLVQRLNG